MYVPEYHMIAGTLIPMQVPQLAFTTTTAKQGVVRKVAATSGQLVHF